MSVDCAIAEVKRLSRYDQVSIIGIRLGASLAWQVAKDRNDITDLVLWNPVLKGSDLLTQWSEIQSNYNRLLGYFFDSQKLTEVMGLRLSSILFDEFQAFKIQAFQRQQGRSLMLVNEKTEEINSFVNEVKKCGSDIFLKEISDPEIWLNNDLESIVPSTSLKTIVNWLSTTND